MDDPALALILEECLALLDGGESIDAIVARFPDFAASLQPVLQLALELKDTAEDAIDVPREFLKDLGELLKNQVEEFAD